MLLAQRRYCYLPNGATWICKIHLVSVIQTVPTQKQSQDRRTSISVMRHSGCITRRWYQSSDLRAQWNSLQLHFLRLSKVVSTAYGTTGVKTMGRRQRPLLCWSSHSAFQIDTHSNQPLDSVCHRVRHATFSITGERKRNAAYLNV